MTSPVSVFAGMAKDRHGPRTIAISTTMAGQQYEGGVGALMPWNDRLYFTTYPSENGYGAGLGLHSIGAGETTPRLEAETNCVDVGRLVHTETKTLFIGRHKITAAGVITALTGIDAGDRVCGFARHPLALTTKVVALTMSSASANRTSRIYEITVATGAAVQVADASTAGLSGQTDSGQHFKTIHAAINATDSSKSRLYVVNNRFLPGSNLSVVNPSTWGWAGISAANSFPGSWINVGGSYMGENGNTVFATGIDSKSAVLWLLDGDDSTITPGKYRLPLASWSQFHRYQQEWMRLRQVSTERMVLDLHGTWYDVSPYLAGAATVALGGLPRIRALSRHYNTYPDFCIFDGMLALAYNGSTPQGTEFPDAGQPQAGIIFRDIEDITRGAKPDGKGWWFKAEAVSNGTESDRMVVRGYDRIGCQFVNGTATPIDVDVKVYESSITYVERTVTVPANGGTHFEYSSGFGADFISLVPKAAGTSLTAWVTVS